MGEWHCLCFLTCKEEIKIVCTQFLRELSKTIHMKCLPQCLEWGEAASSRSFAHCTVVSLLHPRSGYGSQRFWSQPNCSGGTLSPCLPQGSSSSDSLEGQSCDYASKSYDAVVFDVLKVSPEEFAVSNVTDVGVWAPKWGVTGGSRKFQLEVETTHMPNHRDRGI